MFQNILAILFILKLVKRSKFYAPKFARFLIVYYFFIGNFISQQLWEKIVLSTTMISFRRAAASVC